MESDNDQIRAISIVGSSSTPYKFGTTAPYTKYNPTDGLATLELEDDAANANWGGDWYTPSKDDWQELYDNCTFTVENQNNGHSIYTATGPNGNSIKLYSAGFKTSGTSAFSSYYCAMTSTLDSGYYQAYNTLIVDNGSNVVTKKYESNSRHSTACTVRPVIKEGYLDRYVKVDDSSYEVTYAELKQLRNNGQLIPGKYYRITDYVTTIKWTTSGERNKIGSASHRFDIIVRADSRNTLNENAHAAVHEGDKYFEDQKLEAWEIKYSIDSDGGVTNTRTTKYAILEVEGDYFLYLASNSSTYYYPYFGNDVSYNSIDCYYMPDETCCASIIEGDNYFTASSLTVGGTVTIAGSTYNIAEFGTTTYENRGYIYYMKDDKGNECNYDFKNVVYLSYEDFSDVYNAYQWYFTFNTTTSFTDFSLDYRCHDNSILTHDGFVSCNIFVRKTNTTAASMHICYNKISGLSKENLFVGNTVQYNQITNSDYTRMSGTNFKYNTINNSARIYIGRNTQYNRIYDSNNITFGDSNAVKNYYRYIIIEPGNQYIYLNNTQTTSSSNYCQNIKICSGVNNTTTWK